MAETKKAAAKATASVKAPNRVKELYDKTVVPALIKKFNYKKEKLRC